MRRPDANPIVARSQIGFSPHLTAFAAGGCLLAGLAVILLRLALEEPGSIRDKAPLPLSFVGLSFQFAAVHAVALAVVLAVDPKDSNCIPLACILDSCFLMSAQIENSYLGGGSGGRRANYNNLGLTLAPAGIGSLGNAQWGSRSVGPTMAAGCRHNSHLGAHNSHHTARKDLPGPLG